MKNAWFNFDVCDLTSVFGIFTNLSELRDVVEKNSKQGIKVGISEHLSKSQNWKWKNYIKKIFFVLLVESVSDVSCII